MRLGIVLAAGMLVLAFAVTDNVSGVNIHTVGWILMLAGVAGLIFFLYFWHRRRTPRAVLTERRLGIDFTLHYIKLPVNGGQATFGLDQDDAIHAVGDVFSDHWRCTMIDKESGDQCFESENSLFPGHGRAVDCATTWTRRRMKINGMAHGTVHQVL